MKECNVVTGCEKDMPFLPVMVYVPTQELTVVFEAERALHCGTLFPEIYKPFKGGRRNG